MGEPISHITIVGGGTAGWIVASYLNHKLQWGIGARPGVRITVVESPRIPTIGVGEATVPTLKATLRLLQIDEDEFVARTDATIKLAIRFDDWQRPLGDGRMHSYLSPFSGGRNVGGSYPASPFVAYGAGTDDRGGDFQAVTGLAWAAAEARRGPRKIDGPPFSGVLQYAYHVDAAGLAAFLKEICLERGVAYVADDVVAIEQDERGMITSLSLAEHGRWPTELVIDCTGFRGLIVNEMLGEPFDSFADYLLNDRAIPIQVERDDRTVLSAQTEARAMNAGWSWRIPLHGRDGTGLVYSSAFANDDEALTELERLLGPTATRLTSPRTIKMRVGRTRRSWVKNCIAVGGASGFMEPLESTTILAIEFAARWLLKNFPTTDFESALAGRFNREIDRFYDEVRDFLGLHFALSDRDDTPYWRAVRHDAKRSDTLTENLALWRHRLPIREDVRAGAAFGHVAIQGVLIGKGFYHDAAPAMAGVVPRSIWDRHRADLRAQQHVLSHALPDHFALIEAIRARAVHGISAGHVPGIAAIDEEALLAQTQLLREG